MNFDNPRTRLAILRCVGIAILAAGFSCAKSRIDEPSPEASYLTHLRSVSNQFAETEKAMQDDMANTQFGESTASKLLEKLKEHHRKKGDYIQLLQSLKPTQKYSEFHKTYLEWRQKEHESEEKLLQGYGEYMKNRTPQKEAEIDGLTKENDEITKRYTDKLTEIVKKAGFDSIDKFIAPVAPTLPAK